MAISGVLLDAGWSASARTTAAGIAAGAIFSVLSFIVWDFARRGTEIFNSIIRTRNNGERLWLDIEAQLQRRADLVPKITGIAERFLTHEHDTLVNVIWARKQFDASPDRLQRIKAGDALLSSLVALFAVAESYPTLVSNTNIQALHTEVINTENKIADFRLAYNGSINDYNDQIEIFPNNIVARIFAFSRTHTLPIK